MTFLKKFNAKGLVDSPLFLKRIIAVAQMTAQINDKISPKYGMLINLKFQITNVKFQNINNEIFYHLSFEFYLSFDIKTIQHHLQWYLVVTYKDFIVKINRITNSVRSINDSFFEIWALDFICHLEFGF